MDDGTKFLNSLAGLFFLLVGVVACAWGTFTAMASHYNLIPNNFSTAVWVWLGGAVAVAIGKSIAKSVTR